MKIDNNQIITSCTIYIENFPQNEMKLKSNDKNKHPLFSICTNFHMTSEFKKNQSFTQEVI